MNAPFTAPVAGNLAALAHSLMSGTTALLPRVEHELYTLADWQEAAEYALDGDDSELEHMLAREAAWQEYIEDDRQPNAFDVGDFGSWLVRNHARHRDALTNSERRSADFATINHGHRVFARTMGERV